MSDTPGRSTGAEVPELPFDFSIRSIQWSAGVTGPEILFGCPRGRGLCGVPLLPSPPNARGCAWTWDGNEVAPTLSPSIHCRDTREDGTPAGGCGWHGFLRAGTFVEV